MGTHTDTQRVFLSFLMKAEVVVTAVQSLGCARRLCGLMDCSPLALPVFDFQTRILRLPSPPPGSPDPGSACISAFWQTGLLPAPAPGRENAEGVAVRPQGEQPLCGSRDGPAPGSAALPENLPLWGEDPVKLPLRMRLCSESFHHLHPRSMKGLQPSRK